jgi:hypothetical protein
MIALDIQYSDTVTRDITLKPFTNSSGAVISSGFVGIRTNTMLMKAA